MSSRPLLNPFPVITDGDMSQSTLTSLVTVTSNLSMLSYEVDWSGTSPVGTISVQVSNTYSKNADGTVRNPGIWNDLPLSTTPSISGNSDTGTIEISANAGHALRLVYTRTSGTGLLNVTVSGKVA